MYQFDWATRWPCIWSDDFLGMSVGVTLVEINLGISILRKEIALLGVDGLNRTKRDSSMRKDLFSVC